MTLDKIKHYIGENLYNHWREVTKRADAVFWLKKARTELQNEINQGLLSDIKYHAELTLLKHLLGEK
jgi:hypothetical protein